MSRSTYPRALMPFRSGEYVSQKIDPRHVGQVCAVAFGLTVRVLWENGWKSDHDATELQHERKPS